MSSDIITCNIRLHNFSPNWAQIAQYLWKLTNVTIVYLSCPIMLKCFKTKKLYDRLWDIRLNNFGPNWGKTGPNCPFAWKGDILEKLINTTVYLSCLIMLQCVKKSPYSRADHETYSVTILDQTGLKLPISSNTRL